MKFKNSILSFALAVTAFTVNAQDITPIPHIAIISQAFINDSTIETIKDIGKGSAIVNVATYDWDSKSYDLEVQLNPSAGPIRVIKTSDDVQDSYHVEVPKSFPTNLETPTVSSDGGMIQINFGGWNMYSVLKTHTRFVGKNDEAGKSSEWVSALQAFAPAVVYTSPMDLLTLIGAKEETAKTEVFLDQFFQEIFASFPQSGLFSISIKYEYQPTEGFSTSVPVAVLPATNNRAELAKMLGETIERWDALYSPASNGKYVFSIRLWTDTEDIKSGMVIENLMLDRMKLVF